MVRWRTPPHLEASYGALDAYERQIVDYAKTSSMSRPKRVTERTFQNTLIACIIAVLFLITIVVGPSSETLREYDIPDIGVPTSKSHRAKMADMKQAIKSQQSGSPSTHFPELDLVRSVKDLDIRIVVKNLGQGEASPQQKVTSTYSTTEVNQETLLQVVVSSAHSNHLLARSLCVAGTSCQWKVDRKVVSPYSGGLGAVSSHTFTDPGWHDIALEITDESRNLKLLKTRVLVTKSLVDLAQDQKEKEWNQKAEKTAPQHTAAALKQQRTPAAAAAAAGEVKSGPSSNTADPSVVEAKAEMKILMWNQYTQESPLEMSPWEYVAEPYRVAHFQAVMTPGPSSLPHVLCAPGSAGSSSATCQWEVDGVAVSESQGGQTASPSHTFTKTGWHEVSLQFTGEDGKKTSFSIQVMVKYIRREIRSLSPEDLEKFLSALHTIYALPASEGKEKYGSDYRSIEHFVSIHILGAGLKDCDHWHDDAGNMNHHIALTLELERALQVIDPSIAVPYWDYSRDAEDIAKSPVFDDDWFGALYSEHEDHVVDKGRWAFTEVRRAPESVEFHPLIKHPYGLLRSPWNTSPIPYIRRWKEVNGFDTQSMSIGCKEFYQGYNYSNMKDLNNKLNGILHGIMHIQAGGMWGSGDPKTANQYGFAVNQLLIFKNLWRMGYARVPESCSTDHPSSCTVSCPAELYQSRGMTARDVLVKTDVLRFMRVPYYGKEGNYHIVGFEGNPEGERKEWEKILNAICNPGNVGEMYSSTSPYDPLFWLIHPTGERFQNYRRLLKYKNIKDLEEPWGYTHETFIASDNGWMCDWSGVEDFLDLPECSQGTSCPGHKAENVLMNFHLDYPGMKGKTFTNQEFYEVASPLSEVLPYMYDNYRFTHCEAQGYSFGSQVLNQE